MLLGWWGDAVLNGRTPTSTSTTVDNDISSVSCWFLLSSNGLFCRLFWGRTSGHSPFLSCCSVVVLKKGREKKKTKNEYRVLPGFTGFLCRGFGSIWDWPPRNTPTARVARDWTGLLSFLFLWNKKVVRPRWDFVGGYLVEANRKTRRRKKNNNETAIFFFYLLHLRGLHRSVFVCCVFFGISFVCVCVCVCVFSIDLSDFGEGHRNRSRPRHRR